ncbi:hypothetical protein Poli38472_004310 [Pythium oligandrum]|uniref:Golgin-84 n=1 Tax=Pythium oligandrum TaxID=41045 RepID=A0A8K1CPW6_PYTOL|nr:hypothetical protein Poli38472_004310 [Pythium oligandrum]|eukprot:TMW66545.1 hypothetical protein Poli38472_004310 [Pythium oligandrum]
MNWVNSLGTLLESVDQQAALTLSGANGEEDGDTGLLSSLKKGITLATESVRSEESVGLEDDEVLNEDDVDALERPASDDSAGKAATVKTPPSSNNSAKMRRMTPPHSGNGRGRAPGASSMDEELNRLRKENARMKSELRAKEKLLTTSQQNVQVYEEEIGALERECASKLAEMQAQITQLRGDKDADEKNFVQALEMKDSQLQTLQQELQVIEQREAQHVSTIEELKAEIARTEESKDSLWTSATSATQESQQVIDALRAELQETMANLANVKREYADAKMATFTRQSQLEKSNVDLSNTVATLERELARAKEVSSTGLQVNGGSGVSSSGSVSGGLAQLQDDHRRIQQSLVLTKKALHDETRKNEIQRQEIITLGSELKRLKETLSTAQDEASKQIITLTQANEELKERLTRAVHEHSASPSPGSEARIQTLTNRLIEKQESIDALRSKITTLEVRLSDAHGRYITAEEKLAQIERNGGIPMDMEMGTPVGRKGGVRARTNRMANALSRVAPVVERSTRVVTALDVLDRWLFFLGRMFLGSPVARLSVLCYLALIHFWVFVVLSFHTSHLNEEIHSVPASVDRAALFPDGMQVPP